MQAKTFPVFIIALFILNGCGCKKSYMSENYIVEPEDKLLNCQQLIYEINEAEFLLKNVDERCSRPHIFAKFIPCTPMVKMDAARNEYILSDRAQYLRSLYRLNGCEAKLKLTKSSIADQSRIIGWNRYKNSHQTGKTLSELPTNLKK
jgi:hypothetical protein